MPVDVQATGVTVRYGYAGNNKYGWIAKLHWQDDKFAEEGCVEGDIHTRYFEKTITSAINYVVEVAEQFNIPFTDEPYLFYENDGDNLEEPPPENWKLILLEEALSRGWHTYSSLQHNISS